MEFHISGGRARIPSVIAAVFVVASLLPSAPRAADGKGQEYPEYLAIKQRLAQGWNTWNTRSVLSHTLLPEGFGLNLAFKQVRWLDEPYLREALFGHDADDVHIRPGPHTLDGSYTRLDIQWQQLWARVESAHAGNDLVILVTPVTAQTLPVKIVVESAIYWNRPGSLAKVADNQLRATLPTRNVDVYATASHQEDFYVRTQTPYLVLTLEKAVGLSTGTPRTIDEIRELIEDAREAVEQEAAAHGELAEASIAIEAGIAWNLVYEPRFDRVVSTVGRLWNEEYGGYCLFGWDNFFLAYLTSLFSRDLAFANVLEHLRGATDEGFIPNDNRGNGSKSFDRSQPPVGAIMVREVYKKHPERWLLEATFDDLLAWNRWWMKRRLNGGLLSYGSHEAENPYLEPATRTKRAAGYESGMDDSPMYEGVPFNKEKNTLELQDVGLTSLVIADSLALVEMAEMLGREAEAAELRERAATLSRNLEQLWDEEAGLYLNRRSDTGQLSHRLSPTLFYPLLAEVPDFDRAQRMVAEHLLNPEEFWGEWVIPSIARNDPAFGQQRYWKGAVWPPLNFLTYLSLRQAWFKDEAAELASKSLALLLTEWQRQGYVSENYSAITGTGDDQRLSSDTFHSWGALLGIMAFVEAGEMPAPEQALVDHAEEVESE
jgi:glycogen debranching enzyme